MSASVVKATQIQNTIDNEFYMDISMFQVNELKRLAKLLQDFIATGVDTVDLMAAEDMLFDDDQDGDDQ